jgi:hypothetical protein
MLLAADSAGSFIQNKIQQEQARQNIFAETHQKLIEVKLSAERVNRDQDRPGKAVLRTEE